MESVNYNYVKTIFHVLEIISLKTKLKKDTGKDHKLKV
jgi:hypothetical protein